MSVHSSFLGTITQLHFFLKIDHNSYRTKTFSSIFRLYKIFGDKNSWKRISPQQTGLVASSVKYDVNGRQTTEYTVKQFRTYIDGHYAHLVSSVSKVYSDPPIISATPGKKKSLFWKWKMKIMKVVFSKNKFLLFLSSLWPLRCPLKNSQDFTSKTQRIWNHPNFSCW